MSYPVTLAYPATGSPTQSVQLPWPAHNQQITPNPNQHVYTAGDGSIFTVKVGPSLYQVSRTFEALTEQEAADFFAFWEAIKFAGGTIAYQYYDFTAARAVSVPCKIIEEPTEVRMMRDMHDVTIVLEQKIHPDNASEAA